MITDAHCHLVDDRYSSEEAAQVIQRAEQAGVIIISNGTGLKNSRETVNIAEGNNNVWACAGLAYERGTANWNKIQNELFEICKSDKVVGIGEAGLNYYDGISEELKDYQKNLLRVHVETANTVNLPIQIHNRRADDDLIEILKEAKVQVMMHCFNRDVEFMKKCIENGWYISIGGLITYKNPKKLIEVVRTVPMDRLLLETDAPYLAPEPIRDSVNEPKNVRIVAAAVAKIRNTTTESIERATTENARRLFVKMYD